MTVASAGHVVSVHRERGYGVVEEDRSGRRWRFFEYSTQATFDRLQEGDTVTFHLAETRKAPIAADVVPTN